MALIGAQGNTAKQIKEAFHVTTQDDETIACNIGTLNRPTQVLFAIFIKGNSMNIKYYVRRME
jgi:hypothetical protein